MKKGFLNAILSVMLFASFCAAVMGQSSSPVEDRQKKEKMQIVVVEKKERGKSGGGDEFQKPRPEYHKGK